jgi:diguanylate cyclase (GGDEF)-like protein
MEYFEKWSKPIWVMMGFILIVGLGLLDFITGYEISFSLFYLLPISLVVWFAGKRFGIAASIVSAAVWLLADVLSGNHYSHAIIYFWNSAIRFGFFIIVTLLLTELKTALEHEKNLSRTDRLTGAMSVDFYYNLLQAEIYRFQRYKHIFTVAYVDLDNFKAVNDEFGHSVGDTVLRTVVNHAKAGLRKTDIVARLGGDEFAVLLSEPMSSADEQAIFIRLSETLRERNARPDRHYTLELSTGIKTYDPAHPCSLEELISRADTLMY